MDEIVFEFKYSWTIANWIEYDQINYVILTFTWNELMAKGVKFLAFQSSL
jgi:hypothetical protein